MLCSEMTSADRAGTSVLVRSAAPPDANLGFTTRTSLRKRRKNKKRSDETRKKYKFAAPKHNKDDLEKQLQGYGGG